MTNYRTDHRDSIPPAPIKRKPVHRTGNDPPPGRLGVYKDGQRVGHVGEHAGIGVVSRLLGGASAEVGKVQGTAAWIATGPRAHERGHPRGERQAGEVNQDGSWKCQALTQCPLGSVGTTFKGAKGPTTHYYAKLTATAAGRERMNEYKRYRGGPIHGRMGHNSEESSIE